MERTAKNPVVHFEVLGRDAAELRSFYSDVFGWRPEASEGPMDYSMVHFQDGLGIDGGIGKAPQGPGHAIFYVSVGDLQATLAQVERLGGRTVQPPTGLPSGLSFASFTDPEGHLVGLVKE